ncbi:glycosyltransferase family 2 protein [Hyphomonas sp.]|uniref:glycosyltransferase family 2 protein n=1 Tax=Hyphomonas sp. TaxID=87 RepID=UPI00352885B0
MYDETKVAIIIPLYNDEANIARALESAVAQKQPEGIRFEVLVVDDGSKDSGPEIAEDYARRFENVTFLKMEQNGGPAAARNLALQATDAGWFTPFDSDDIMLPERVAALLAKAQAGDFDIVADNLLISSSSAPETVSRHLWPEKPQGDVPLTTALFVTRSYDVEMERTELGFLKPLIRRRAVKHVSETYQSDIRFGEDFELYARLLADGAKAVLTDPEGYLFVVREGSASQRQGADDHRKMALRGREFLKRDGLGAEERAAFSGFTRYSEREWAAWTAIEAVRAKNLMGLFKAFTISSSASLFVAGNLLKAVGGKLNGKTRPVGSAT